MGIDRPASGGLKDVISISASQHLIIVILIMNMIRKELPLHRQGIHELVIQMIDIYFDLHSLVLVVWALCLVAGGNGT